MERAQRERIIPELAPSAFIAVVNALADAVTIRGRDNRLLYANQAALERLGIGSLEELRASDPQELMDPYDTFGEDGEPVRLDDLPSVRVLRGEDPEPLLLRSVHRETGNEQWVLLKAALVADAVGGEEAAVTIIEDVTEAKRAALRSEFLVRVGSVLASSLDHQQTLRNVAGLVVPQIADWCAVDLFDERGAREPVAVAHVDPDKLRTAAQLRTYEADRLDPERGLGRVWSTGEPQLYLEIPDEMLVAAALDEQHLELLREVGLRSVVIVPMRVSGRTFGALTLVSSESARSFDESDVGFAQQIADRAALAVENSRLYTLRRGIARTLQNSLLPEALPQVPGWEISALYRPAGEESDVGGDFYDFWEVDGSWMMIIGDVTGKGVGAATVTSLVRHTASAAPDFEEQPAEILARVDAALKRRPAMTVCTALCARIAGDRVEVACGGHPPLLRLAADGISEVGEYGTLLGAFPELICPEVSVKLNPGETLVAYTDGVTDAIGRDGERFGAARLQEILHGTRLQPPDRVRSVVVDALDRFQIGPQADDTAVVIMRYVGMPDVDAMHR
ncbi:MAG TPA: SpoIIE family protein phosphatase [Solirubrobacteraceae bacterium]|nr:SpoIIE family protein phosphatase [Solirubrobacteraceae bacterium]